MNVVAVVAVVIIVAAVDVDDVDVKPTNQTHSTIFHLTYPFHQSHLLVFQPNRQLIHLCIGSRLLKFD